MKNLSNKLVLSLLLGSAVLFGSANAANKCRVLGLSAAYQSGAYQAGALQGLINKVSPANIQYDVVTGVSGGSMNAALLAMTPQGQEQQAVDRMLAFWRDTSGSKLYKNWFGGVITGFFIEGGLYNDQPLKPFIKQHIDANPQFSRDLYIGLSDFYTGDYRDLTHETFNGNQAMLEDALWAQFAMPGYFPPAKVLGSLYFDGSAIYTLDLMSGINACKNKGFAEPDITVDALLTFESKLTPVNASTYHAVGMLFRFLEVSHYYQQMDGIVRAQFSFPNVNWRYAVTPSKALKSNSKPFDLSDKEMEAEISQGIADAEKLAVSNGNSFDNALHFYHLTQTGDKKALKMTYSEFLEAKERNEFGSFKFADVKDDIIYFHHQLELLL